MPVHFKRSFYLLTLFFFLVSQARAQNSKVPASLGISGDEADVVVNTQSGVALIGGGGNVNSAFKWMTDRSGGGDVVVITASGNDAYNKAIYKLGGVNSVQTLNITSKEIANSESVAGVIRNAEMLFIAGGDQSRYMNYWRGTRTQAAINYLLNVKKVPVGGTSAGCAILSGLYYSGEQGSVISDSALLDPYTARVTLYHNDLLQAPFLEKVITDQHYITRNREGRHIAFMARIIKDWGIFPKGIAPDERTAVCIDENGMAKVFGENKAYFILTNERKTPEKIAEGQPLQWNAGGRALRVYEIQGSDSGSGRFSVKNFSVNNASGGTWYRWYVNDGKLYKTPAKDTTPKYVMVVHGGAGTILKKYMTSEKEKAYIDALTQALQAGFEKIRTGKSSLDAVEAAIRILEDNPLFNAGKGAVFTHDGRNEWMRLSCMVKHLLRGQWRGLPT